jgi:hypothetical protein
LEALINVLRTSAVKSSFSYGGGSGLSPQQLDTVFQPPAALPHLVKKIEDWILHNLAFNPRQNIFIGMALSCALHSRLSCDKKYNGYYGKCIGGVKRTYPLNSLRVALTSLPHLQKRLWKIPHLVHVMDEKVLTIANFALGNNAPSRSFFGTRFLGYIPRIKRNKSNIFHKMHYRYFWNLGFIPLVKRRVGKIGCFGECSW